MRLVMDGEVVTVRVPALVAAVLTLIQQEIAHRNAPMIIVQVYIPIAYNIVLFNVTL